MDILLCADSRNPRVLDNSSFFQGLVGPFLINSTDGARREGEGERLIELRYENTLLLEVHLAAALPGRVELGCAGAV